MPLKQRNHTKPRRKNLVCSIIYPFLKGEEMDLHLTQENYPKVKRIILGQDLNSGYYTAKTCIEYHDFHK